MSADRPVPANSHDDSSGYVEMTNVGGNDTHLSPHEVALLKQLLARSTMGDGIVRSNSTDVSVDSDYPEFMESTHAWAVFADNPKKRATNFDRIVGTLIIIFQLFTYWMFTSEAIQDYQAGKVAVMTSHSNCLSSNEEPQDTFSCEADFTSDFDAFVAYFMLGIFLSGDFLQAGRVIKNAPCGTSFVFACLAGIEVLAAFVAACFAISYNLFIGEVTDAVEVGVGLLFIRELSQRAYTGIRQGNTKQYKSFFSVLLVLIAIGMAMDPFFEFLLATKER